MDNNNNVNGYTPATEKGEDDPVFNPTVSPVATVGEDAHIPSTSEVSAQTVAPETPQETTETQVEPAQQNTFNNYTPNGRYSYMPPATPKKKDKKYSAATVLISVVCAAVIGALSATGCFMMYGNLNKTISDAAQSGTTQNVPQQNITIDGTAENVAQAVAAKCAQSIVSVRTTYSVTSFFGGSQEAGGEGSGVIYSSDGYIITNHHVIADALGTQNSKVEVFFASNTEQAVSATIVGYNVSTDLAVLKVNKTGLPAVELGTSSDLKLGANAVVIGNPGGIEFMNSVTSGIISGLNRSVATESGATMTLIQTDAAINPGNSGGGLFNEKGKLIGITNSKLVSTQIEGIGFAIPVDSVKEICDKIIAKKDEAAPYVGIEISQRYTADTLKQLGYPAGAVVNSVASGSPAENSGIRRGDIITEFNGVTITNYTQLSDAIKDCKVGSTVTVKLYRSGKYYSATIKVEANNAGTN